MFYSEPNFCVILLYCVVPRMLRFCYIFVQNCPTQYFTKHKQFHTYLMDSALHSATQIQHLNTLHSAPQMIPMSYSSSSYSSSCELYYPIRVQKPTRAHKPAPTHRRHLFVYILRVAGSYTQAELQFTYR